MTRWKTKLSQKRKKLLQSFEKKKTNLSRVSKKIKTSHKSPTGIFISPENSAGNWKSERCAQRIERCEQRVNFWFCCARPAQHRETSACPGEVFLEKLEKFFFFLISKSSRSLFSFQRKVRSFFSFTFSYLCCYVFRIISNVWILVEIIWVRFRFAQVHVFPVNQRLNVFLVFLLVAPARGLIYLDAPPPLITCPECSF